MRWRVFLGLPHDRCRDPDGPAQESVPWFVRGRDVVLEHDRVDLDTGQPAVFEQGSELFLIREPEEGRATGYVVRRRGARLGDRVEEHAHQPGPFRQIPGGQREMPAGRENPDELF